MFYEIVDLFRFSGQGCTIYSVIPKGATQTIFEDFVAEYGKQYPEEMKALLTNLTIIGKSHGMRECYYKPHEGRRGDQICALFIIGGPGLRLYFIKYHNDVILLGGGGYKAVGIHTWQEDPILNEKMNLLMSLSDDMGNRLVNKDDLWWSEDLKYLEGYFKNYDDEEEDQ
jgi:hypothetical protein